MLANWSSRAWLFFFAPLKSSSSLSFSNLCSSSFYSDSLWIFSLSCSNSFLSSSIWAAWLLRVAISRFALSKLVLRVKFKSFWIFNSSWTLEIGSSCSKFSTWSCLSLSCSNFKSSLVFLSSSFWSYSALVNKIISPSLMSRFRSEFWSFSVTWLSYSDWALSSVYL